MPFHSSPGFLLVAALSVALVQGPLASHRERAAFQPPTVTSSPSIGLGALGRRARTCVSRNFLHMASPSAGVGGTWTCNDDLKPSTQGQKPLQASTWQWLTERTKGHTAQFDVIVRRSARRFEVQEQRSALLHKREVVSRLIADLDKNQEHLEIFRRQVRDIELNLAEALAASKHRIIEDAPTVSNKLKALEDGLLSARENLQGFEDAASAAREQAQILALDLRTTEAKVRTQAHTLHAGRRKKGQAAVWVYTGGVPLLTSRGARRLRSSGSAQSSRLSASGSLSSFLRSSTT